ncbi:MBL fold metallo-hydrolase [Cellulomonas sp. JH27-2]|uniref:MBL fold metallo-hydrolase n=1 Tax=Cellulomonas sp. JH27-2 TaxID=2774139 RepID=UPI0017857C43|nr:MBL fold metallo-hydrolase [Cellulomonas sp. JH27-2]MBD8058715.1 MBL fold metallo-hydrolase [Cellulomonas sp. JH27-2]
MEVFSVVSDVFGARCTVVVGDDGSCLVVDAGAGVAEAVVGYVREHALTPTAVLLTHGHVDHTWDAARLAEDLGVPVRMHAADVYRLADPFGTLGILGTSPGPSHDPSGPLAQALLASGVDTASYRAPSDVVPFGTPQGGRDDDVVLQLGAVRVVARHAPGHTQGSTLYLMEIDGEAVAFTGDVLFAGSVGRTDLPGGDAATMADTLTQVVARLDPQTVVVPGHGPTTDVATELSRNPYL